jgi:serine/threonine protein kinase
LKLSDFGIAKRGLRSVEKQTSTFCGTHEFVAPEMLKNQGLHNKAVDWWCLGIMAYEMLSGVKPFENVKGCSSSSNSSANPVKLFKAILSVSSFTPS